MIKDLVSKIIKFFYPISFWVFIYFLLVIIHLHFFGVTGAQFEIRYYFEFSFWDYFLQIFAPFLILVLGTYYSPFHIVAFLSVPRVKELPFLLRIRSEKLKKVCLYIIPLFISLLIFFHTQFMMALDALLGGDEPPAYLYGPFPLYWGFQILAIIIFSYIYAQNKENIIFPKITKFIPIFVLGAIIYLAGFVYYGSQLPLAIRELTKKAVETKNPFFCEEIIKEGEKRGKIEIPEELIERCLEKIIKETKNPKICDQVKNEEARNHCFKIAAFSLNDPQLCERINPTNWRGVDMWDECFLKLARELNNSQLCERIKVDHIKEDCFYTLALQLNNLEICYKIAEDYEHYFVRECLEDVKALNKPELCKERETYLQDECFMTVAIYSKNPQLCEKAEDFDKCLKEVAIYSKDPQLCEKIEPQPKWPLWYRDTCFETFAYKLNKLELCEKIMEKQKREWCVDKFE